ncbi:MAG: lipid-A-disaccharide synthase [Saprospiraceae bacterium]
MKYFIIAGEASGDLHGSNLVKALRKQEPNCEIVCWGGDLMEAAGATLLQHYRRTSFMGFLEVLKNLRTILGAIRACKNDIEREQPNTLILIDFPGFNFRIAEWAKPKGLKILYYISPQLWAWKENRIKKVKRDIDRMFVILPFEKDFYKKHNYEVDFVGHPLLDVTENFKATPNFKSTHQLDNRPIIALLPGSRKQEIENMLSKMLAMVDKFTDYQFIIAAAPSQSLDFYDAIISKNNLKNTVKNNIKIIQNQTYDILNIAEAALVTSGTATLETALFNVPQVVCYKGSSISYYIAKQLVKIKYISLVNLIADKPLVTELIQNEFTIDNLEKELIDILNQKNRKEILLEYQLLKKELGGEGASGRVANLILNS